MVQERKTTQEQTETYLHLIIDGNGIMPAKLEDETLLVNFLKKLAKDLEPDKTSELSVGIGRYPGISPQDESWGLSAFTLLTDGHISLHAFPKKKLLWVDLWNASLVGIDTTSLVSQVSEAIQEAFEPQNLVARNIAANNKNST